MQIKKATEKQIRGVIMIQKHWKGYIARKKYRKLIKPFRKKTFIAKELVQSERIYCENLEYVIKNVLEPSKLMIHD